MTHARLPPPPTPRPRAGKTVALVGGSGSGKSTVLQLIQRLYDPAAGAVLLDGRDVRGLQLRWLRRQLGVVLQEPTLFDCSIRENIMWGCPEASEEQVVAAATSANAHAFIAKLPQGWVEGEGAAQRRHAAWMTCLARQPHASGPHCLPVRLLLPPPHTLQVRHGGGREGQPAERRAEAAHRHRARPAA